MAEKFPDAPFDDIGAYWRSYSQRLAAAAAGVDLGRLAAAAARIRLALEKDGMIFACGNGGSAAIANHLQCDFAKGIHTDTDYRPRIVSLSANVESILAIANDISFADIFAHQLTVAARAGDLLIAVSSSGNSENIVRALDWARGNGLGTIALTGFAGGRAAAMAEINLHVPAHNYGICEDIHQSLMHTLAQFIRQAVMPPARIASVPF
jgi:D-sedoheptulose 7-phosphate isomerase